MLKRIIQSIVIFSSTLMLFSVANNESPKQTQTLETVVVESPQYSSVPSKMVEIKSMSKTINEIDLTEEEIELIALIIMAEAEGESEEGQRLVIDTILNRVESEYFPDTVSEVIYQPSQFSCVWNGRVDRCYVKEELCQLIREEIRSRTNYDVMFFTAGKYGNYGEPMFSVGNHYFSSYQ